MNGVTDLEISAGVRRELSGRRVDLSKLKFKVTSGEVLLTGELAFVGLEKDPGEVPVEIKFIEDGLKAIRGVSDLKIQFENWVQNDSGKWESKGGSGGKIPGGTMIPGEGFHCPSCKTVMKFCPCCGQPLTTGDGHAKSVVPLGRLPVRPALKKPEFGRIGISKSSTGISPFSRPPDLKPVRTDGPKPELGGKGPEKPAVTSFLRPGGAPLPAGKPPFESKTGVRALAETPPGPVEKGKPPLTVLPPARDGVTSPKAEEGKSDSGKPSIFPAMKPAPLSQISAGQTPLVSSPVPLKPSIPTPLVKPSGPGPASVLKPVSTATTPSPFRKPVFPQKTPETQEGAKGDSSLPQKMETRGTPPTPDVPKSEKIAAIPGPTSAPVASQPSGNPSGFASPAATPEKLTDGLMSAISDLSLDDTPLPPPKPKAAVSPEKPPPFIPPKRPGPGDIDLSGLSLDEETPLPPMKPKPEVTEKSAAKPSSKPADILGLDELSLDDTPLPPIKSKTVPPPPIPETSDDDEDILLPPLKSKASTGPAPVGGTKPKLPAATPSSAEDDDTPLPPIKPAVSSISIPKTKSAPVKGKDAENPFSNILDGDTPLPPQNPEPHTPSVAFSGYSPPRGDKPAAQPSSNPKHAGAKDSLDDILNLDFGLQDIFQSPAGGKAKPATQAGSHSSTPKAPTKPKSMADDLNLDDILDLTDISASPKKPDAKAAPKKDNKTGDGKKDSPEDFDISKFKI